MPQMISRLRTSSDPRAHATLRHDALGGLADVPPAIFRPLSTRKRAAVRRPFRIALNGDRFGAHAFIQHDALGGLADVQRIQSRNV